MTLRVYCTGFGRTGTNSLKEALEILGYPCFHMVEIIDKKAVDPTLFIDALHGKPIDWGFHLQRVYSCLRLAGFYFYKEIIDHYPDAKIIYTDRDPDKLYDSVKSTIWELSHVDTSLSAGSRPVKFARQEP